MIGMLPTLGHEVSGTLFVEDEQTFCIQDFNYDGNGPGMYIINNFRDPVLPFHCVTMR